MNIVAAVLSFNPLSNLRDDLVRRSVESVSRQFGPGQLLYDNGSDDGSQDFLIELAKEHDLQYCRSDHGPGSPGTGRNRIMSLPKAQQADVVVFSDDDVLWKDGSAQAVEKLWAAPQDRILIISGLLEPVWHWNTPRTTISRGGINVLVRDSAPAAAWTLRPHDWSAIGPLRDELGEDHDACQRLKKKDFLVAQVDLADHLGSGASIWGNDADTHVQQRPLDREKWQV